MRTKDCFNKTIKQKNDLAEGCTSVVAGKMATKPCVVLLARNEDVTHSGNEGGKTNNVWNKYLKFREIPAYENINPGADWLLGNGLKVPAPSNKFAYSAMPDANAYKEAPGAVGDLFYFEARGINEHNVAISATNTADANQAALDADNFVATGIEESIIPTLILPQASNAGHAVKLLGDYIENYGASESACGILIGDPGEAWYFEIGSGHHWIAVKVPDDSYLIVANGLRIHSVDLNDDENVKYSKGIFEFVRDNKLLINPEPNSFNFATAFGIPGVPYNIDRIWLGQNILSPSTKQAVRQCQYPLFLKPDKKITLKDVMEVLRATYKNTKLESIAKRPIGIDNTAESHIITLDPDAQIHTKLRGIIWQTMGTPLGSPYIPLYNVMSDIPPSYSSGNNTYSSTSAYWAFKGLYALSCLDKNDKPMGVHNIWHEYEQDIIAEQTYIKKMLIKMCKADPIRAVKFAARYSRGIASQSVDNANYQLSELITNIARISERTIDHGDSVC